MARGSGDIASPCVKICEIDREKRICIGCYRTITEIGFWTRMSAEERAEIMAALPARAVSLRRRGRRTPPPAESAQ